MRGTLKLAILLTGALAAATPALADEPSSVRVSYADLNLGSESAQQTLQRRIAWAARNVCAIEDSRQMDLAYATTSCRREAIDRAQPAYDAAVAAFKHGTVTVLDTAALIVSKY